jgi:hypothetical protein
MINYHNIPTDFITSSWLGVQVNFMQKTMYQAWVSITKPAVNEMNILSQDVG